MLKFFDCVNINAYSMSEKRPYILVSWTMIGGKVGYHGCTAVFNKGSALNFPLTILTITPLGTWWHPGITKCQGSLESEKASPMV